MKMIEVQVTITSDGSLAIDAPVNLPLGKYNAVLAVLNQERNSQNIAQLIDRSATSTVNLAEVITKMADAGIPEEVMR